MLKSIILNAVLLGALQNLQASTIVDVRLQGINRQECDVVIKNENNFVKEYRCIFGLKNKKKLEKPNNLTPSEYLTVCSAVSATKKAADSIAKDDEPFTMVWQESKNGSLKQTITEAIDLRDPEAVDEINVKNGFINYCEINFNDKTLRSFKAFYEKYNAGYKAWTYTDLYVHGDIHHKTKTYLSDPKILDEIGVKNGSINCSELFDKESQRTLKIFCKKCDNGYKAWTYSDLGGAKKHLYINLPDSINETVDIEQR